MKKVILIFVGFIMLSSFVFVGCSSVSDSVVRIHIRANSNNEIDQEIKLVVRDNIVKYITPIIEDCSSSDDVKSILSNNLKSIEDIANTTLINNGFNYSSNASINNEFFPSRDYDGVTFPADYYDALIIRLGEGKGDNWWCVAYPPLCFVDDNCSDKIEYKSILIELIKKCFS